MKNTKFDLKETITQQIIDNLETSGKWVSGCGSLYNQNLISKKPYTGINTLLLAMSRDQHEFTSNIWGTYKQFAESGKCRSCNNNYKGHTNYKKKTGGCCDNPIPTIYPKKGSKSTMIIFYKDLTIKDKETKEDKIIPMMRYYRVFNGDQIEGIKLEKPEKKHIRDDANENNILLDYIKRENITLNTINSTPCYYPSRDELNMPELSQYDDDDNYLHVLGHECVHSTGHKNRLNREGIANVNRNDKQKYSLEELVAELGALFIDTELGTQPNIQNSSAYIKSWCKYLKDNKSAIFQASSKAYKAYEYIIK